MITKLTLNQKVTLEKTVYKIIGIDHYSLKNILGKEKQWTSYTLLDKDKNKTWISYGAIKNYFIQWFVIPQAKFSELAISPLNTDLTGISHITFEGDSGYSTPTAEIVWWDIVTKQYDFAIVERFLRQEKDKITPQECYYQTGKLLKNFQP